MDWFLPGSGVFDAEYIEEQQRLLAAERTLAAIEYVDRICRAKSQERVSILDVCCGHGRHAIPLAARGYRVIGVDINPLFLDQARLSAKSADVNVAWIMGDLRSIMLPREMDIILCLGNSFGYCSDDENEEILSNIARSVKRDGQLVMEILNHEQMPWMNGKSWKRLKNSIVLSEKRFDIAFSRLLIARERIFPDWSVRSEHIEIRTYGIAEMRQLLQRHGLKLEMVEGGFCGEVLDVPSEFAVLSARKTRSD